jgi:hypothetical protein
METVIGQAAPRRGGLGERIAAHLGVNPAELPVTSEEFDPYEQPNIQVALDDYLAGPGRVAELVGVGIPQKRFFDLGLSDLVAGPGDGRPLIGEGPVEYVNFHLAGGRVLSCVQFGLYLLRDGDSRLAAFVSGPLQGHGPQPQVRVQVMAVRPEEGAAFLATIKDAMRRLNVYRGQTISLSPSRLGIGPQTLVAFQTLRAVERSDVILPGRTLDRIERHTIGFAAQAERLQAAGRSLKRGLLLYGPPGTGKTLTVSYLAGQMSERTVILATGLGLGMLPPIEQLARDLAPAMVVLEDVDLIAEERGNPFRSSGPLLFELLNALDGLGDDCDVIFVLTTNRPEILEPALAARPGRVDLAVELPLPDADGRRRLFDLYARGLRVEGVDVDAVVASTDGASPAYIKELLRLAATLAALGSGGGAAAGLTVTESHLNEAMAELDGDGELARRLLGFGGGEEPPGRAGRPGRGVPPGFPGGPGPAHGAWVGRSGPG